MRSRHDKSAVIPTLNVTDNLLYWLELFDPSYAYDILPTNWAIALAPINPRTGKKLSRSHVLEFLSELTCARPSGPQHLLMNDTFAGVRANQVTMKYWRTGAGHSFAAKHGRPMLPFYRPRNADMHQLFGCLTRASLDIGMRRDGFKLETPKDIFSHPKMGEFDPNMPYTFKVGDLKYTPDDDPLVLRHTKESKLLLSEDDRNSMGIERELGPKIEKIIEVWKRRLVHQKYGRKGALLLFKTDSDRHAENVREFVFKKFGRIEWFLIKAFPEFADLHKTIPVTTKAWDEPWMRPGCSDYSLKILAPVDALGVPKNDPTYRSPEEKFLKRQNNPHGAGGAFRGMKQ